MAKDIKLRNARVLRYDRLRNSVYGCPQYTALVECNGVLYSGKTGNNASINYCLTNFVGREWDYITFHYTAKGNIIFTHGEPPTK